MLERKHVCISPNSVQYIEMFASEEAACYVCVLTGHIHKHVVIYYTPTPYTIRIICASHMFAFYSVRCIFDHMLWKNNSNNHAIPHLDSFPLLLSCADGSLQAG